MLHAGAIFNRVGDDSKSIAECRRRYAEIFYDVEKLIENQCMFVLLGVMDVVAN